MSEVSILEALPDLVRCPQDAFLTKPIVAVQVRIINIVSTIGAQGRKDLLDKILAEVIRISNDDVETTSSQV